MSVLIISKAFTNTKLKPEGEQLLLLLDESGWMSSMQRIKIYQSVLNQKTKNFVSKPEGYFATPHFSENKQRCIKIANEIIRAISETPKSQTVSDYIKNKKSA